MIVINPVTVLVLSDASAAVTMVVRVVIGHRHYRTHNGGPDDRAGEETNTPSTIATRHGMKERATYDDSQYFLHIFFILLFIEKNNIPIKAL